MTVTAMQANRSEEHGEFVVLSIGPIGAEVRVVVQKALTQEEIITQLERVRLRLLEIDIPAA